MLVVCAALAGCSTTQRATFYLPVLPAEVAARERGLGVVFIDEPFCVAVSEGPSANISVQTTGPALLPAIPLGNALSQEHASNKFVLIVEIVGSGTPFTLPTLGIALRLGDGSELAPTSVQTSLFSTHQQSHWTPIGNRDQDVLTHYHHDAAIAYSDLSATLEIADTVRLTLTFEKQASTADPENLEFPAISTSDRSWHMPPIKFSRVTRTKYNPGGGVTGDGVAVGSHPVTLCRKLGHSHD